MVGIYDTARRISDPLLGLMIPASTALTEYGNPAPATMPATMVISTKIGAARLVARQAPLALRPEAPQRLIAVAPPDPHTLRDKISTDLTGLFLALAAICLVIGAVGIANTTLVAVMERTSEIGLRRALGARPHHIAGQFLAESLALGTLGGLIGTSTGVLTVLSVAAARNWTAVLTPSLTLTAPLLGSIVGLLAGAYPALRAARISPARGSSLPLRVIPHPVDHGGSPLEYVPALGIPKRTTSTHTAEGAGTSRGSCSQRPPTILTPIDPSAGRREHDDRVDQDVSAGQARFRARRRTS